MNPKSPFFALFISLFLSLFAFTACGNVKVNENGVWKDVPKASDIKVNVDGTTKDASQVYVYNSGTWAPVYDTQSPFVIVPEPGSYGSYSYFDYNMQLAGSTGANIIGSPVLYCDSPAILLSIRDTSNGGVITGDGNNDFNWEYIIDTAKSLPIPAGSEVLTYDTPNNVYQHVLLPNGAAQITKTHVKVRVTPKSNGAWKNAFKEITGELVFTHGEKDSYPNTFLPPAPFVTK